MRPLKPAGRDLQVARLEDVARAHGIEIRKGKYDGKSGLGKWRGNWVLLIDRSLSPQERVELLTDALAEAGVEEDPLPQENRSGAQSAPP